MKDDEFPAQPEEEDLSERLERGDENAQRLLEAYQESPEAFDEMFDKMFPPEEEVGSQD